MSSFDGHGGSGRFILWPIVLVSGNVMLSGIQTSGCDYSEVSL
jgi:hypothetical protein